MKLHILMIIGFAIGIAGCAKEEQPTPEQAAEPEPPVSTVVDEPLDEPEETMAEPEEAAEEPDETLAKIEDWRTTNLLDHMHAHAEHLDDLNYALDDGDLERAMTPAYWLSRHKEVSGLPENLQPFVVSMREAASAVEQAEDLDTARAGAQQIGLACQGCHDATGVAIE